MTVWKDEGGPSYMQLSPRPRLYIVRFIIAVRPTMCHFSEGQTMIRLALASAIKHL